MPIGAVGTVWSYRTLRNIGIRKPEPIDWLGNATFAIGLVMVLSAIVYGINPSEHSSMSWTTPFVIGMLAGGIVLLVAFSFIERKVATPMFKLGLFRIRAFVTGSFAAFLASVARGGLMFMLTIWLQGIWLPLHGYDFEVTPLWAGIYMVPSSVGFLVSGPLSGRLSDRFGARYFATIGMILAGITFVLLLALPVDFAYPLFAAILFLNGLAMGMFIAPNTAAIMNSVPPRHRGAGSGMLATLNNVGMQLSMGIFFSLLIVGMNATVPQAMYSGLTQSGIPAQVASQVSVLPPVGFIFAAFMGYNPLATLIPGSILSGLPADQAARITSRAFFPQLIDSAFHRGLIQVMLFSMVMCLAAAGLSWLRGGKYVYAEDGPEA